MPSANLPSSGFTNIVLMRLTNWYSCKLDETFTIGGLGGVNGASCSSVLLFVLAGKDETRNANPILAATAIGTNIKMARFNYRLVSTKRILQPYAGCKVPF